MEALKRVVEEIFEMEEFQHAGPDADSVEIAMILSVPNSTVAVLKIDGRFVDRDSTGLAKVRLEPGRHVMAWRLFAAPESEYIVSIIAPPEIAWKHDLPLRTDKIGFGGDEYEFDV